jgi:hypothetical protein
MAAPVTECENCGHPDPELVEVQRIYVHPGHDDQPDRVDVVEAPEWWCISCVTQYPCRRPRQ